MTTNGFCALLGAGASKPAGLPLAAELTSRALEAAQSQEGTALFHRFPMHEIYRALVYTVAAIRLHDARDLQVEPPLLGIERLVSAVELLAGRSELEVTPFVQSWDPAVERLDTLKSDPYLGPSLRGIAEALEKIISGEMASGAIKSPLSSFATEIIRPGRKGIFDSLHRWLRAQLVKDVGLGPDADVSYLGPLVAAAQTHSGLIATLNYDLALEKCAKVLNVPLNRMVDTWGWGSGINETAPGVPLYKLHGSVDWVADGPDNLDIRMRVDHGHNSVSAADTPVLVYGQREKLRSEGPFLELLDSWRRRLMETSRLMVAGYSFGDAHINMIVRRWLLADSEAKMVVVDPGFPDIRSQYDPGRPDLRKRFWERFGRGAHENVYAVGGLRREEYPEQMFVRVEGIEVTLRGLLHGGIESIFSNVGLPDS